MKLVFDIGILWLWCSSEMWLSGCYLNTFYSVLTVFYFYMITNFDFHFIHHYCDYCHYYCCYYYFHHFYCYYYFSIFNGFNFRCSSFYQYLYINQIFLNFKRMTWLKIVQSLQQRHWGYMCQWCIFWCLWWELWTVLTIFFWSVVIIFWTWQLVLLFCRYF